MQTFCILTAHIPIYGLTDVFGASPQAVKLYVWPQPTDPRGTHEQIADILKMNPEHSWWRSQLTLITNLHAHVASSPKARQRLLLKLELQLQQVQLLSLRCRCRCCCCCCCHCRCLSSWEESWHNRYNQPTSGYAVVCLAVAAGALTWRHLISYNNVNIAKATLCYMLKLTFDLSWALT